MEDMGRCTDTDVQTVGNQTNKGSGVSPSESSANLCLRPYP